MKKTREELEAEIKRLQEELNPKPISFVSINGVPQKIVKKEIIAKGRQKRNIKVNGRWCWAWAKAENIPVYTVEDAE